MINTVIDGEQGSSVRAKLNALIAAFNSNLNAYSATNSNVNNAVLGVNSAGTFFNTGMKMHVATGALLLTMASGVGITSASGYSVGQSSTNVNLAAATTYSKTVYQDNYLGNRLVGTGGASSTIHSPNSHLISAFSSSSGYTTTVETTDENVYISSDNPSFSGIQYAANYSANFNTRSLIDYGCAQSLISSAVAPYLLKSGGTMSGIIRLPQGTALDFYDISNATKKASITHASNVTYFLQTASSQALTMSFHGINVITDLLTFSSTDAGFSGAKYDADYSANFVSRSIPDVGYVNNYVNTGLASKVDITGATLTGPLLYSSTPTSDSELVNRAYVWDLVNGIDYKDNVAAATTANVTLSGIQTIDGIPGGVDKRILVKNQTTASENGIYLMKSGAWVRADDANTGVKLEWAVVPVSGGSQSGQVFRCNQTGINLGSTAIAFTDWSSGTYYAGSYLSLSGSTFNINFASFSTTQITEGTNLYYTDARARGALSASGVISYNSTTGAFTMAAATSSVNGYLASSDWTSFDAKNNLTTNYVGYGNGSGKLTGASTFTYNGTVLNVGNKTTTGQQLFRLGQGASWIDMGCNAGDINTPAIYFNQTTLALNNYGIMGTGNDLILNAPNNAGSVYIRNQDNNGSLAVFSRNTMAFNPVAATSGTPTVFTFTTPASTGQTASTNTTAVLFDMSATITHAAGALTSAQDFWIKARTHSAATSTVYATASTVYIDNAPQVAGLLTITNPYALNINAGNVRIGNGYIGVGTNAVNNQPLTVDYSYNGQLLSRHINSNGSTAAISSIAVQNNAGASLSINKLGSGYNSAGLLTAGISYVASSAGDTLFANLGSSTNHIFAIGGTASSNEVFRAQTAGVSFSGDNSSKITTVTAYVHIAGSTASRASLRIESGVDLTSPNDGDIWFNGSVLKMRIGGVTKTFTLT